jgi:hypothetical protein
MSVILCSKKPLLIILFGQKVQKLTCTAIRVLKLERGVGNQWYLVSVNILISDDFTMGDAEKLCLPIIDLHKEL